MSKFAGSEKYYWLGGYEPVLERIVADSTSCTAMATGPRT